MVRAHPGVPAYRDRIVQNALALQAQAARVPRQEGRVGRGQHRDRRQQTHGTARAMPDRHAVLQVTQAPRDQDHHRIQDRLRAGQIREAKQRSAHQQMAGRAGFDRAQSPVQAGDHQEQEDAFRQHGTGEIDQ